MCGEVPATALLPATLAEDPLIRNSRETTRESASDTRTDEVWDGYPTRNLV